MTPHHPLGTSRLPALRDQAVVAPLDPLLCRQRQADRSQCFYPRHDATVMHNEILRPPQALRHAETRCRQIARVQLGAPARGISPAHPGQCACPCRPGVSGTGAESRIAAALGAARGVPERLAEIPWAAAEAQRGPYRGAGCTGRGRGATAADLIPHPRWRGAGGHAREAPWRRLGRPPR